MPAPLPVDNQSLKRLLGERDPVFFEELLRATSFCGSFSEMVALSTFRKRAAKAGFRPASTATTLRLAMVGGCTLFPLADLVQHCLETAGHRAGRRVELFTGAYDNYISEIMTPGSPLYEFKPDLVFVIPSERQCKYSGTLFDSRDQQEAQARKTAADLVALCRMAQERSGAELVVANFRLPAEFDPGPYRGKSAASDWTFRKMVNLELGLSAPSSIQICDVEFLSSRYGTQRSFDHRGWFESKQPYTLDFQVLVAREVSQIAASLRGGPKKVVVLDLDNTLWGGVVGDDGLEGIEVGDTSPRGEAFKAFQAYLKSLGERGILLAVCSKNDRARAVEPFEEHPEMVLRMKDFASFQANWEPKSENLRRIARDLNLGLDSFVFVDDNPAEIEIVRQFVPEVETVLLGPDPSEYVRELQDRRYFETLNVTREDAERATQYQVEAQREQLLASSTDMPSYLRSLGMTAVIAAFQGVDVPRIAQLINKSNQFNLTTRRRTELEVRNIIADPAYRGFTVRLADRFGDHGLISVVICRIVSCTEGAIMEVDTWLMSCRVLKRQVEEEVVNEIIRLAQESACARITGRYIRTAKNEMVSDLYPRMGFRPVPHPVSPAGEDEAEYELVPTDHRKTETAIAVTLKSI
jgi:FkbH-like protein